MAKLLIALALSILLLIFVLQNLQTVELHFLFWQFNGSLALILALTFIITLIISLFAAIPYMLSRGSKKNIENKSEVKTKEVAA